MGEKLMSNGSPVYSVAEKKMLTDMYLGGHTLRAIADAMEGRSMQSIAKQTRKLGLIDRKRTMLRAKTTAIAAPVVGTLSQIADNVDTYQTVLSNEAANAVTAAFSMVRSAETPAELNTALGAAQKADQLYRKANGLGEVGASQVGGTYNFYVNAQASSPLSKARTAEAVDV